MCIHACPCMKKWYQVNGHMPVRLIEVELQPDASYDWPSIIWIGKNAVVNYQ